MCFLCVVVPYPSWKTEKRQMSSIRRTPKTENTAKSSCDRDLILKILMIGGPGCGKTSLIRRYVHDAFHSTMRATVGVDFALKQVHRCGGSQTLQLWDVAGQEKGANAIRVYFQAAAGAMIVCDATRLDETLPLAILWKRDIDSKVFVGPKEERIPCILLVNKCDVEPLTQSHKELLDTTCHEHHFCGWLATSAKANTNVAEAFEMITDHVLAFIKRIDDLITKSLNRKSVTLNELDKPTPESRCPC